jgi:hypothetical protein
MPILNLSLMNLIIIKNSVKKNENNNVLEHFPKLFDVLILVLKKGL